MAHPRTLLLISSRPDDLAFAKEIAEMIQAELVVAPDPIKAAAVIDEREPRIIFADCPDEKNYKALEAAIQEKVGLFSDKISANAVHFLSLKNLEEVPYLIQSPFFGNFVLRNYQDPVKAGHHYGKVVRATLADRAFGLEGLLNPGAKVQVVKLGNSTQKQEAVEAVKNYAMAAKFQSRMASLISNAVDELLMNAIFDAPVDDLGKPTLVTTPRNAVIKLEGKNSVEMHVGFDGEHIAISAVDLYGSLDKNKLMSHISKIYTQEEYRIRQTVAGAGLGLATVFRTGGSFFFSSEQRVRTEVTVFFQNADSFRAFRDQFRFISTQFYF